MFSALVSQEGIWSLTASVSTAALTPFWVASVQYHTQWFRFCYTLFEKQKAPPAAGPPVKYQICAAQWLRPTKLSAKALGETLGHMVPSIPYSPTTGRSSTLDVFRASEASTYA